MLEEDDENFAGWDIGPGLVQFTNNARYVLLFMYCTYYSNNS